MTHFEALVPEEIQLLEDAIPYIALLIAGADGKIDVNESEWAMKLTHIRSFSGFEDLREFYKQIDVDFSVKFAELIKFLPSETAPRQQIISEKLATLNPILKKLDPQVAYHLYTSFRTYAKSVADAAGTFLGFHIGHKEEDKWVGLEMIHPILEPKS